MSSRLIGDAGRELREDALLTARLRLERWHDGHFEPFARMMSSPAVIRHIRPDPLDASRAAEQHERSLAEWEENGFGKRAAIEVETDAWIGFVELSPVGPGKGCRDDDVEIGYFLDPLHWQRGLATEAATAIRDEAFEQLGLEELIGRCRVENTRSARVLRKLGFELLRPVELAHGIVVQIHRLRRERWERSSFPELPRLHTGWTPEPGRYRETG